MRYIRHYNKAPKTVKWNTLIRAKELLSVVTGH